MTEWSRPEVERELARILETQAFRGSKRSQDFLRYVVNATLDGHPEALKERMIGVEIFGRATAYDTGEDAIVRVKANEVRKRLAQAYQEVGDPQTVRIDLPAGSYAPEFRHVRNGIPPPVTYGLDAQARRRTIWLVGVASLLMGAVAVWLLLWRHPEPGEFGRFWAPVFDAAGPVVVCVANPPVYLLAQSAQSAEGPVPRSDVTKDTAHYVGMADAQAMARIAALLGSRGKQISLRPGNATEFQELKQGPAVFIGAFTNAWTMEVTREWRFRFDRSDGRVRIIDGQKSNVEFARTQGGAGIDYAIVARVLEPRSGQVLVVAAGLAQYGTKAAGEFVTDATAMNNALNSLQPGWERKNLQLVLETKVVGDTPGPVRVVASHLW